MEIIHKFLMILITLIIDMVFVYILRNEELNLAEKYYIYGIIVIHVFFMVALLANLNIIIDLSHIFLFLAIYLGVLIKNRMILIILALLSSIQICFKALFGGCIMCTQEEQSFGYFIDKYNQQFVYIALIIITYKLLL